MHSVAPLLFEKLVKMDLQFLVPYHGLDIKRQELVAWKQLFMDNCE